MCQSGSLYGKFAIGTIFLCAAIAACTASTVRSSMQAPASALSLQTGETLAVISVGLGQTQLSDAEKKGLLDRQIGFGLVNLLKQELDSTGKFRLMEEREIHRELIGNLLPRYWIESRPDYSEQELRSVAAQLKAALLAYATISYRSYRQRVYVGPFVRAVQKLHIDVEACLYQASTQISFCRSGEGESQRDQAGIIYELRDDRIDFGKNASGVATQIAAERAVQNLIASIQFLPGRL